MKRTRDLLMMGALLLGLWALPCFGQGENPPAAQAGKTSGHGMTAVEQTPGYPGTSTENQIKALEAQISDALIRGDASTLDRLYSDDYVSISATSGKLDKQQLLDNVRNGNVKFEEIKPGNEQVRVYGNDTAVSTGTVEIKSHSKSGGDVNGEFQYTRVWVKRNGRWQSVSFQNSPVSGTQSATKEH